MIIPIQINKYDLLSAFRQGTHDEILELFKEVDLEIADCDFTVELILALWTSLVPEMDRDELRNLLDNFEDVKSEAGK
jgi:hypothetical protein